MLIAYAPANKIMYCMSNSSVGVLEQNFYIWPNYLNSCKINWCNEYNMKPHSTLAHCRVSFDSWFVPLCMNVPSQNTMYR